MVSHVVSDHHDSRLRAVIISGSCHHHRKTSSLPGDVMKPLSSSWEAVLITRGYNEYLNFKYTSPKPAWRAIPFPQTAYEQWSMISQWWWWMSTMTRRSEAWTSGFRTWRTFATCWYRWNNAWRCGCTANTAFCAVVWLPLAGIDGTALGDVVALLMLSLAQVYCLCLLVLMKQCLRMWLHCSCCLLHGYIASTCWYRWSNAWRCSLGAISSNFSRRRFNGCFGLQILAYYPRRVDLAGEEIVTHSAGWYIGLYLHLSMHYQQCNPSKVEAWLGVSALTAMMVSSFGWLCSFEEETEQCNFPDRKVTPTSYICLALRKLTAPTITMAGLWKFTQVKILLVSSKVWKRMNLITWNWRGGRAPEE